MAYWYHPESEDKTVGAVMRYQQNHVNARWKIEFGDEETYICDYLTDYQSDNSGELEIEDDDPRYDEFYEIGFLVLEVLKNGPRQPGPQEYLAINYRDFPTRITNADTGEIIFSK